MGFADLATLAHASLVTQFGAVVTYHRAASSVSVTAVLGRTDKQADDLYGATVAFESDDFIVIKDELNFGAGVITPKPGDKIKRVVGGTTHVYEVVTPPFHPSDSTGARLRIHTKFVATE